MSLSPPDSINARRPPAVATGAETAPPRIERETGVRAIAVRGALGLAGRLLALMVVVVFVAQGLLFATRVAAVQDNWLRERIAAAYAAALAFGAGDQNPLPPDLEKKILDSVGAEAIVIESSTQKRVLSRAPFDEDAVQVYDMAEASYFESVRRAFMELFASPGSEVVIAGPAPMQGQRVILKLDVAPLSAALWRLSHTFLTLSLSLSTIVTLALWLALWRLVIRPVRRLTTSIIAFGESPQRLANVISPSGRHDEIGRAEAALAMMQTSLTNELSQRKRLAELGMAVARINHDLRNMLSAAQLISDRLATIPDPLAQRLAPRLVGTLDRAIAFCQSTLAYGAGREREPEPRRFDLRDVVRQIVETAEAQKPGAIAYAIDIPPKFEVFADPDHVLRVIENLGRNAAEALAARQPSEDRPAAIRFAAIRADGVALIEISDTGPGFSPSQSDRIFEPFHNTTRDGGAGLGLAIAADLVERNRGVIALAPTQPNDFYCGARFLIRLPTPESAGRSLMRAAAG